MTSHAAPKEDAKLAQRLAHIIARLHQGDAIDKHQLAHEFGVNIRTIDRDLGKRLEGIAERTAAGHWQLTPTARSTIPTNYLHRYAQLSGTQHLFPDTKLSYLLQELHPEKPGHAMHVQPVPHEDLATPDNFATLQQAIEKRNPCRFTYKNKPRHVEPYRLLHKNGVWYLSAEEDGMLKNFSVALIQELQVDEASRFVPKKAHHDYINAKDDVWFTSETTEVLLRVNPEIAHYFKRRQLLPRQQEREDRDGSLLVTTHINHINQLLPVVRYWLPNVRIIKPVEWHEELMQGLNSVLRQWDLQAN